MITVNPPREQNLKAEQINIPPSSAAWMTVNPARCQITERRNFDAFCTHTHIYIYLFIENFIYDSKLRNGRMTVITSSN